MNKPTPINTEIDLVVVARTLWNGKRKIIFFIIGFSVFGLILAFLTPKEYTAKTIWVNQLESAFSANSSFEGLAAMAGFDLRSMDGTNELTPADYPDFIESLSFQYKLMHTAIEWERFDEPISLYDYYYGHYRPGVLKTVRNYTLGLPKKIVRWLGGKRSSELWVMGSELEGKPVALNNTEIFVRSVLSENLEMELNEGNNIVTLEIVAFDPVAAKELARVAQVQLQDQITELKIDKARQTLKFTEGLYIEKKAAFEDAQDDLAKFRDRNLNLNSQQAMKEEEMLQSIYQIAFSVYSELATELETAKIRVKEDTPIFSVVEEAMVPNFESKPKELFYLLIWGFLGGVIGFVLVLLGPVMKKARVRWGELDG